MMTRRQALAMAAMPLLMHPARALGAAPDSAPLSALVAYQQEVVLGYEVVLRKAPIGDRDHAELERFRNDAGRAAAALRKALEDLGGKPTPAPGLASAAPAADPSRRGYLRELIKVEEAAVASYYTALQQLSDERHLSGSAAFMAQSGRRLVVLRKLAGAPLVPRAFETGMA
jgi:hypothetical protein